MLLAHVQCAGRSAYRGPRTSAAFCWALAVVVMIACSLHAHAQDKQTGLAFSPRIAAQLLSQVREGLEGGSQKKLFTAFALDRMAGGAAFKQQIDGLLTRTESIRVHLNLVEATSSAENQATVLVDAEMEAGPSDNSLPVHKRARLTFSAEKTAAGWKFVGLQPRSFFSL